MRVFFTHERWLIRLGKGPVLACESPIAVKETFLWCTIVPSCVMAPTDLAHGRECPRGAGAINVAARYRERMAIARIVKSDDRLWGFLTITQMCKR